MELFLLVSMVLTFVSFSLIVLSEPAAPSMAEHDSDRSIGYTTEESAVKLRETLPASIAENSVPQPSAALAAL